ncbi:FxLYD domain-containing protein [Halalkalicoccus sp. NIPERK01]|uniref:FxLYD domain-containing protein n=1 Tax=Halalkalicoccus sp. NIPERK01 TaxID=3053469 RepID=UPI00256F2143|nr:FxLYD domain-containing protein [Halalkalicoccus sp. NIPERK01]MDL5361703.1 FxLYD domain-containing protein [Halalkalicoccus sp. NIPERK01]
MRRRELLVSTGVACALAVCVGDDERVPDRPEEPNGPDDSEEPDRPEEGERVEIVESVLVHQHVGTDEETVSVRGVVVPQEGVEVSYVEIRASFYDAEGELLDTTIEQVEIDEGDRWNFEVVYPQVGERATEVEDYELEVGTEL